MRKQHPKRVARQERAAKRLAAWNELTPEQQAEREALNKEMYDARKSTQGRMKNGHSGS